MASRRIASHSSFLSTEMTCAPSLAKRVEMALPIPPAAPVTTVILLSKAPMRSGSEADGGQVPDARVAVIEGQRRIRFGAVQPREAAHDIGDQRRHHCAG